MVKICRTYSYQYFLHAFTIIWFFLLRQLLKTSLKYLLLNSAYHRSIIARIGWLFFLYRDAESPISYEFVDAFQFSSISNKLISILMNTTNVTPSITMFNTGNNLLVFSTTSTVSLCDPLKSTVYSRSFSFQYNGRDVTIYG